MKELRKAYFFMGLSMGQIIGFLIVPLFAVSPYLAISVLAFSSVISFAIAGVLISREILRGTDQ